MSCSDIGFRAGVNAPQYRDSGNPGELASAGLRICQQHAAAILAPWFLQCQVPSRQGLPVVCSSRNLTVVGHTGQHFDWPPVDLDARLFVLLPYCSAGWGCQ